MQIHFNMKSTVVLIILLTFVGCGNRFEEYVENQKGYIISFQLKYFYFIPTTSLNLESALSSFETNNLETGFQFSSYIPEYKSICAAMDTFYIEKTPDGYLDEMRYLKITPVMITYRHDDHRAKFIKKIDYHDYCTQIRGKKICLTYSNHPYEIINVTPLKVNKRNIIGTIDYRNREPQ